MRDLPLQWLAAERRVTHTSLHTHENMRQIESPDHLPWQPRRRFELLELIRKLFVVGLPCIFPTGSISQVLFGLQPPRLLETAALLQPPRSLTPPIPIISTLPVLKTRHHPWCPPHRSSFSECSCASSRGVSSRVWIGSPPLATLYFGSPSAPLHALVRPSPLRAPVREHERRAHRKHLAGNYLPLTAPSTSLQPICLC